MERKEKVELTKQNLSNFFLKLEIQVAALP